MNVIPFTELSSAEQLEIAQVFRDGGLADLEALTNRRLAEISIFAAAPSSATALHNTDSDRRLAELMRDWGR